MEIYATKISDIIKKKVDELCLFVSLEKKHKIERFVYKKDKIRALIGELLIKTIITEKLGVISKNIIFNKNEFGKPYLKDYQNFNFNISHSGDFVVCAIDDKPIGIDIEQVKYMEYKDIAERFFSESEFEYIIKADLGDQIKKFYEIWTLKESYIKCCGQGLSIPLKSFSINMDGYENIKVVTNTKFNKFTLNLIYIDSDYKMAVCTTNEIISKEIIMIDQNDLINNYL